MALRSKWLLNQPPPCNIPSPTPRKRKQPGWINSRPKIQGIPKGFSWALIIREGRLWNSAEGYVVIDRIRCKGDSCDDLRAEMPTKLGSYGSLVQKRATGLVVLGGKNMEKIHGMTNNVIRATQLNVGNKHQTHEIIRIPSWGQRLQDDSMERILCRRFFWRWLNRCVVKIPLGILGSRRLNRKGWGRCLNLAARKVKKATCLALRFSLHHSGG